MEIKYRAFQRDDTISLMQLCSKTEWEFAVIEIAKSLIKNIEIAKCYLAEKDYEVIGFVYGFALPNNLLVPHFIYVSPEYRKNGIAKKLLFMLEKESNCKNSIIYYNKSLHDYYSQCGYESSDALEVAQKELDGGKNEV